MSPELLRMAKRAALPIVATGDPLGWIIVKRLLPPPDDLYSIYYNGPSRDEAVAAYFDLVESLTPNPDTSPSLVSGAADCSVSSPPGTR